MEAEEEHRSHASTLDAKGYRMLERILLTFLAIRQNAKHNTQSPRPHAKQIVNRESKMHVMDNREYERSASVYASCISIQHHASLITNCNSPA